MILLERFKNSLFLVAFEVDCVFAAYGDFWSQKLGT